MRLGLRALAGLLVLVGFEGWADAQPSSPDSEPAAQPIAPYDAAKPKVASPAQALKEARATYRQGRYEEALAIVEAGLELDGKNLQLLRLRGAVLLEQRDYDGALAAYEAFLAARPRGANARKARKIVANLQVVRSTFLAIEVTNGPARIYLEGKQYGVWCVADPECVKGVVPRSFQVIIERQGFEPKREKVSVQRGKTVRLELTLDEKPSQLDIAVAPETAEVSVDGKVLGPGAQSLEVAAGEHQVRATLEGHAPFEQTVSAAEGKPIRIDAQLKPESQEPKVAVGTPEARNDEVWDLYHRAYAAAAEGRANEARAMLARLASEHPEHPSARQAEAILAALEGEPSVGPDASPGLGPGELAAQADRGERPERKALGPEKPSRAARAELAILQLFHGLAVGGELCALADCESGTGAVLLGLLGGAAGMAIPLATSKDRLTQGDRALLNSGTLWGAYHGIMVLVITDPDDAPAVGGTLLLGQGLGLALGGYLTTREVTEGQVALANTFGIWSGVVAFLAMGTLEIDRELDESLAALVAASDVGLLVGSVLSQSYQTSRGYTLLIDAGGVIGLLGGLGTANLIDEDPSTQLWSGAALAGTVIGLGVAAYAARQWAGASREASSPLRLTVFPTEGGFSAGVAFDLDL